jgi:hypothetical protein
MGGLGLALIALVGVVLVLTGLPAYAVLILQPCWEPRRGPERQHPVVLLGTLPGRLINLLESDLLQALPLYVLMGVLLNRMSVAPAVFRTLLWLLPNRPGASVVAGLGLGALLGPMSGSVGASVLALGRAVEPSLSAAGLPAPLRQATIALRARWGGHSTLAGSHTARRCDAERPHAGRQRHRPGGSRHQYQDVLRAPSFPRRSSVVEPGRRLVFANRGGAAPPPRASDDRPGARSF